MLFFFNQKLLVILIFLVAPVVPVAISNRLAAKEGQ